MGPKKFIATLVAAPALIALSAAAPALAEGTRKLTPALILADAAPVVQVIMVGLMAASLGLLAALAAGAAAPRWRSAGADFAGVMVKAGPLLGGLGAAYGVTNSFIGVANTNTTNLAVVAPGFAEALLSLTLGLLAGALAVIVGGLLKTRAPHPAA